MFTYFFRNLIFNLEIIMAGDTTAATVGSGSTPLQNYINSKD